jgi:hypothetical protein
MSVAPAEVRPVHPPRPVIATVIGLALALALVMTAKAVFVTEHAHWSTTWSQALDHRHLPSFLGGHTHRQR